MYKELVDAVNTALVEAIDSDLTKNIAKLLKQQQTDFSNVGFSYDQTFQLVLAIAGKKS